jgi:hypothetical protein
MPTYRTTVGPNRTVTLSVELCRRLGIKQGTPVEFFLTVDGQVHFHAITGTARGFGGIVSEHRSPPISIREMDDAIADHLAEKNKRILNQSRKPSPRKTPSAAE